MSDAPAIAPTTNRARWIVLVVFGVLAALVIVLATRPQESSEVVSSPLVGQPAPNVTGTALDGRTVDLQSLEGRYVVVNFFATWCGPCKEEHPDLKAFSEANTSPSSPTVVAVAFRDANSNVRNFFAQNGGGWPVVPDEQGQIAVDYGIRGLPESYVIDPEGKIAAHVSGALTLQQLNQLTRV